MQKREFNVEADLTAADPMPWIGPNAPHPDSKRTVAARDRACMLRTARRIKRGVNRRAAEGRIA